MMTTDEKLEQAYQLMAIIVRDHGEKYLPIFKRLHDEMALLRARKNLQNIALQVAREL